MPLGWPTLLWPFQTSLKKSPLIAPSRPETPLVAAQCEMVPSGMSPDDLGGLSAAAIRRTCGSPSRHDSL